MSSSFCVALALLVFWPEEEVLGVCDPDLDFLAGVLLRLVVAIALKATESL